MRYINILNANYSKALNQYDTTGYFLNGFIAVIIWQPFQNAITKGFCRCCVWTFTPQRKMLTSMEFNFGGVLTHENLTYLSCFRHPMMLDVSVQRSNAVGSIERSLSANLSARMNVSEAKKPFLSFW